MSAPRLVAKNDFDGLACGVLLRSLGLVGEAVFVHPSDVDGGRFEIADGDVTAGLPYKPNAGRAFTHLSSASVPPGGAVNLTADVSAPSTARVIHDHFGKDRFPGVQADMLDAVDKGAGARLTTDDILYPTGWMLFNFLIDPRTGLERSKVLGVPHGELMRRLMEEAGRRSVWELLSLPEMEERLELYFDSMERHKSQVMRCSSVHYNLIVTDTRKEASRYPGNRFVAYALFPECNVSLDVSPAPEGEKTVFSAGRSILDRTCSTDIGSMMRKHGGGGHAGAGACRVENGRAPEVLGSLIGELRTGLFKNLFLGYFNYY